MQPENNFTNFNVNPQPVASEPVAPETPVTPAAEPVASVKPEVPKKSMGWMLTAILFMVATLGLGGWMIFDMMQPALECPSCENTAMQSSITNTLAFQSGLNGLAVVYEGEVYVHINDFSRDWTSYFGEDAYQTLLNTQETYVSFELDGSLFSFWQDIDTQFIGMKLDTENVIGLAEANGLALLYEDGTIGYISAKDLVSGLTDVSNIDEVTEATEFTICPVNGDPANGAGLCVVTESEEEISISDYITEL
ncbi:MAG: hypothetical protein Q4B65_00120 [Candidatus Saccharibacteria bacterium]|nr:hypothetical protein [Candidatus Saccharibacteria bacterium]